MTVIDTVWAAGITLASVAEKGPDPADVKPGWLGFGVFLALAAAVVLLWLSFRKQLRKVDFEERDEPDGEGANHPDRPEQHT